MGPWHYQQAKTMPGVAWCCRRLFGTGNPWASVPEGRQIRSPVSRHGPGTRRRLVPIRQKSRPAHAGPAVCACGRGEKIRTSDPLHPMQVRYQAALRPDRTEDYTRGRATIALSPISFGRFRPRDGSANAQNVRTNPVDSGFPRAPAADRRGRGRFPGGRPRRSRNWSWPARRPGARWPRTPAGVGRR